MELGTIGPLAAHTKLLLTALSLRRTKSSPQATPIISADPKGGVLVNFEVLGPAPETVLSEDQLLVYMDELCSRIKAELVRHGEDYHLERLREPPCNENSQPVEVWFDVSFSPHGQDNWRKQYVALSATKLLFFESHENFLRREPSRMISLELLINCIDVLKQTGNGDLNQPSETERWIQINYVLEGETRLLPWMKRRPSHDDLIRCYSDHKASPKTSKSLYLRAASSQEKEEWLMKFRACLERCEYQGESGVAAEAMLCSLKKSNDVADESRT